MHISQLITPSRVVPDLSAATKMEALAALAKVLARDLPQTSADEVLDIFLEREQLGSTGIGKGVAVPHGRLSELSAPIAALGRSYHGVAFDALDSKPVYLIIALLSPLAASKTHLAALTTISRLLLHREGIRERLHGAEDQDAFFLVLTSGDTLFPAPVSGD